MSNTRNGSMSGQCILIRPNTADDQLIMFHSLLDEEIDRNEPLGDAGAFSESHVDGQTPPRKIHDTGRAADDMQTRPDSDAYSPAPSESRGLEDESSDVDATQSQGREFRGRINQGSQSRNGDSRMDSDFEDRSSDLDRSSENRLPEAQVSEHRVVDLMN